MAVGLLVAWIVEMLVGLSIIVRSPDGLPVGLAMLAVGLPVVLILVGVLRRADVGAARSVVPLAHAWFFAATGSWLLTFAAPSLKSVGDWLITLALMGWTVLTVVLGARMAWGLRRAGLAAVIYFASWCAVLGFGVVMIGLVLTAHFGLVACVVAWVPIHIGNRLLRRDAVEWSLRIWVLCSALLVGLVLFVVGMAMLVTWEITLLSAVPLFFLTTVGWAGALVGSSWLVLFGAHTERLTRPDAPAPITVTV